MGANHQTPGTP